MTAPLRVTVADAVRAELARARVPVRRLQEVLGLSEPTMSNRMMGRVAFTLDELEKISQLLGVPPTTFVQPPPQQALAS